jgi:hypothetical protein
MNNKLLAVFMIGVLGNTTAWAAADANSYAATGFDYSTGNYGSSNTTTILSIPLIGIYRTGPWMFKLTVPYVRISGDGSVVSGLGGAVSGQGSMVSGGTGSKSTNTTRSGLGDVIAAATYNIYSGMENGFLVDLTGKVKFGTADTSIGTGENDYAVQVDVYQSFNRFTAMGALGYQVLGSPAGVDMNNAAYGILGGYYQVTNQTGGGVEMKVSQKPSVLGAEQRELTAYVSHRLDKKLEMRAYVLKGFADGSPDSGFGVLISSGF